MNGRSNLGHRRCSVWPMPRAKGQTATAEAIYSVMEQDSDADVRAEARYRRARLYIAKGRKREAAVLLRRVLDEKPDAAPVRLELANVLAGLGDREAALRELRAAQSTGLPPAVARMVDRYSEALRASRPTGGSFEIALAPDSNINRATRLDSLGTVIGDFEIDEDSKARIGHWTVPPRASLPPLRAGAIRCKLARSLSDPAICTAKHGSTTLRSTLPQDLSSSWEGPGSTWIWVRPNAGTGRSPCFGPCSWPRP